MLNPRSWQSQKFLRAFIWLMLFSGLSFNVHSASNDFLWEYNVTGLTQSFKSLSEAEAAMRSMADKELSSGVTEMHNKLQFAYMANSNTRRYTIPPLPAKIGPWVYWVPYTPGGPYDNEQAAVQNVIDYFSYDGCQTTAAPTSDWYVYPGANQEYMIFWLASVQFKRDYKASIDCPNRMPRVTTFSALISRAASPVCPTNYPPKYSEYTQALQDPPGNTNVLVSKGCQNYTIGTITSRMVNALCDKDRNPQRGNPCNPATGNKHETEEDFPGLEAVGINFERSYNSLQINHAQTALGMGWTHS